MFLPSYGGYKNLISYKKAEIVFDATVYFTGRFFKKGDRTVDQMVQAARSGKQNIAEASLASGTSKEMELKLTNVARASQEELLVDYRDFLRVRSLREWQVNDENVKKLRMLNNQQEVNYATFKGWIENPNPEVSANTIIGLIKVTNYLLDKLIIRLQEDFTKQGGIRERMTKARLDYRREQEQRERDQRDRRDPRDPRDKRDQKDPRDSWPNRNPGQKP